MKRQMGLLLVLTIALLLSLVSLPATVQGQQPPRFSAYTGMVTLGQGQVLRVTVDPQDNSGNTWFRFAWAQYMAVGCSGMTQVCRHTVVSQGATPRQTPDTDEALSFDVPGNGGTVKVTVQSNSRNAEVLLVVFDTSTQRVVSIMHPFGDF